ncbi:site-specific DNA-methyltransferase, partial [Streptomyces sp. MCAF7]
RQGIPLHLVQHEDVLVFTRHTQDHPNHPATSRSPRCTSRAQRPIRSSGGCSDRRADERRRR